MKIEDKVHISLTPQDVTVILKKHFKEQGIDVKELHYDVKTKPDDDSIYSSYKLVEVTGHGTRC